MERMERVNRILSDGEYQAFLQENGRREQDRLFCRHDLEHMLDVARLTYILLLEAGQLAQACPGAGRELAYAAGLLHDIGRWRQYDGHGDHAADGARLAGPILERAGFSPQEAAVIRRAIGEHRSADAGSSCLGAALARADDLSRPCFRCRAREHCYKAARMETAAGLMR